MMIMIIIITEIDQPDGHREGLAGAIFLVRNQR
jgi:hypothetical protein